MAEEQVTPAVEPVAAPEGGAAGAAQPVVPEVQPEVQPAVAPAPEQGQVAEVDEGQQVDIPQQFVNEKGEVNVVAYATDREARIAEAERVAQEKSQAEASLNTLTGLIQSDPMVYERVRQLAAARQAGQQPQPYQQPYPYQAPVQQPQADPDLEAAVTRAGLPRGAAATLSALVDQRVSQQLQGLGAQLQQTVKQQQDRAFLEQAKPTPAEVQAMAPYYQRGYDVRDALDLARARLGVAPAARPKPQPPPPKPGTYRIGRGPAPAALAPSRLPAGQGGPDEVTRAFVNTQMNPEERERTGHPKDGYR